MSDRLVNVTLTANTAPYVAGMNGATAATQRTAATAATANAGIKQTGATMATTAGQAGLLRSGLTTPIAAAGAAIIGTTKASIDWESSWAGVTKTVDGSATQMERLEGDLRNMATELPATHSEIAGVAEAAGQLGIAVDDVAEFSRVMVDLGETTNLSAEQAATSIARFGNIMGTAESDIERLGSSLVDLGNNSETTEAEILELATRMAAAGQIAGLSESDVLGFAAAVTSVGVPAEAAGTALSKTFQTMRDAVLDGGEALDTFAETAGMSANEFATAFKEDPAAAIASFIEGLGRMNEQGQSTTGVFEDLGLNNERLKRALLSTAEAGDLLTDSVELGNEAWEENTALAEEAENRYSTTASQLSMAMGQVKDAAIDLGGVAAPVLAEVAGVAADLVSGLQVGIAKMRELQVQAAKDSGATDEEASQTRTGFLPLDVLSDLGRAAEDVRADVEALAMGESFWDVLTDGYEEAEEASGVAAKFDSEIQGLLNRVPEATEDARTYRTAQLEVSESTLTAADSLANYQDQLRAATDPVFALQQSLVAADEAQDAYNDAVDEYGKNSPEAEGAALDLAEAVAAAEQAALDGDLSFDAFDAKLARWVEQGVITAEQADVIRGRVEELTGASDEFEGERTAQFATGGVEKSKSDIQGLLNRADRWSGHHQANFSATYSSNLVAGAVGNLLAGRHQGGPVMHDGGPVNAGVTRMHNGGLRSDERAIIAQEGEFMMQRSAVDKAGLPFMHAVNAGNLERAMAPMARGPMGGGGGAAGFGDQGGHLTGNLYLETGEFMGVIRGEVRQGISEHDRRLGARVRQGTGRAR